VRWGAEFIAAAFALAMAILSVMSNGLARLTPLASPCSPGYGRFSATMMATGNVEVDGGGVAVSRVAGMTIMME
jgi:hypothetical protein